jgi:hypothetical protein
MTKGLHHFDVVVRDLDAAVSACRVILGLPEPVFEDLEARGARTARFPVGDAWLVLVQPLDPGGPPGRHLAEHGEGLGGGKAPADIVDAQLVAYNARDLDRFVATYSVDVEVFRPPEREPVLRGREALARFYAMNRFCHEALRAEVLKRLVVGNLVADHERIHGLPNSPIELVATYEIQEALIRRVWLLSPTAR